MATPHKCPVCEGCGKVQWPPGYTGSPFFAAMRTDGYTCPTCNGTGIVWEPDLPIVKARYAIETHST